MMIVSWFIERKLYGSEQECNSIDTLGLGTVGGDLSDGFSLLSHTCDLTSKETEAEDRQYSNW